MVNCVDCGLDILEIGVDDTEIRCNDCEYRFNLKKGMRVTSKYCLLILGLLFLGEIIFLLIINGLFHLFSI
ncbi:MAG: hypothetical protein ACXABO_18755 [Promethearchaeota archaeon]|jgi:DNA-directed RNA polymerase subunit RPC12/RpoP